MVVPSEKGKEISIKTEVTSSSIKPFEDQPVEHEEEASKRKYEVIGTDIEMEYEDMDTEDEEREVRKLTKEELEMYHQYKEFYTIQARTRGKMPSFGYIHRLKVKERYPGVPTDLVKTFSHPIEGYPLAGYHFNVHPNVVLIILMASLLPMLASLGFIVW